MRSIPTTGLVYLAAKNGTHGLHAPDAQWKYNPKDANLGADARYEGPLLQKLISLPPPKGELVAWDPVRQRAAWRASYPVVEGGGVLTTAANLVFQGRADGILAAYRATDGKQVWQFDAGTGIMAPPITYSVDGVQYVSVMAGWGGPTATFNAPNQGKTKPGYGRMLTFALGGKATLTPRAFARTGPPTPAITVNASPAVIHEGQILYTANCASCHGLARRGRSTSRSAVLHASGARAVRGDCAGRCARDTRHAAIQGSPEARSSEGDPGLRALTRERKCERHRRNDCHDTITGRAGSSWG